MKAQKLKTGDTIGIVGLSSGMPGDDYAAHELELAERRLTNYGFRLKYMTHARRGTAYLDAHPEARAQDFLDAFADSEVKAVVCAIGGDDTFRLAPYLFEHGELKRAVQGNPKLFLGIQIQR